ncbi:hypothetical protein C8046_11985 [Serinibacter arcticus]|uniref:DUF3806 domain-containing protein n=1 Tax=Serinibacter arcticus TaxID=1655435 RepID=A0A2U1ZWB1_9MICO|nr:DUF3806 domain-containing protein [Serinibacter arcticus]PWD51268.1 hypothetical protein C8046_11985 [Serinibacter arcticus]
MWGRKKQDTVTSTQVDPATPALVVEPLDADWTENLTRMREWVASCVAGNDPPLDLAHVPTALSVIDALLADGIRADETWKLQALGAVLGDAMARDLGVPWRLVTDQWGATLGLHLGGEIVAYPLTMIAKRVEAGEPVDVRTLFVTATDHVRGLLAQS